MVQYQFEQSAQNIDPSRQAYEDESRKQEIEHRVEQILKAIEGNASSSEEEQKSKSDDSGNQRQIQLTTRVHPLLTSTGSGPDTEKVQS